MYGLIHPRREGEATEAPKKVEVRFIKRLCTVDNSQTRCLEGIYVPNDLIWRDGIAFWSSHDGRLKYEEIKSLFFFEETAPREYLTRELVNRLRDFVGNNDSLEGAELSSVVREMLVNKSKSSTS